MGLRFRRSIKICKGVKVNFGKTGASLSVGTKGFHKTFHTSGKVTTSIGIPGTGISWVDTKNPNSSRNRQPATRSTNRNSTRESLFFRNNQTDTINTSSAEPTPIVNERSQIAAPVVSSIYLNNKDIREIYTKSDYPIDWTDISISSTPEEIDMDRATWSYCKSVVDKILDGDIDTYLDVIDYLRPVDDLIAYAGDFEFGTDKSNTMSVEYTCLTADVLERGENDPLYEEFTNAVAIRIARDIMALLPVSRVNVFIVNESGSSVNDITFTKRFLRKANYNASSATEIVNQQLEVSL